jgi:hypothetical protein
MDPFFQLYCCACHNYFMYCDCVHSYEDIIVEDEISHESEGGEDDFDDDFDDMEFPQPDADHPFDVVDDFFDPNKWKPTSGMSTDPSPGKRPKPDPGNLKPGPTILVDKPPADAGEGNKPSKQENVPPSAPGHQYTPWQDVINNNLPKPGKIPKKEPPTDDIKQVALSYFKNGVPYPYWTSPSVNSIMDAMDCPVYTGPQVDDAVFQKFVTEELYPWYENLPDADKRTYLSACFVADPRDGVDQGPGQYFHVAIKFDHHVSSGRVEYPYIYQISPIIDGVVIYSDTRSVYSDKRLPARAFSNEESFDKYFQETKPGSGDYVCTYKQPRSTPPDPTNRSSLNAYRFYESSIADPPPYLPSIDVNVPDPPPAKPTRPDNWFVNSRGNTKSINGIGYKDEVGSSGFFEPFFDAGYISQTLWKTNANDPQYPTYPIGNVPNPLGFTGIVNPAQMLNFSSAAGVFTPNDYSKTIVYHYGNDIAPQDVFCFPCECVNINSGGASAFYYVSIEMKTLKWEVNNPKFNVYSMKGSQKIYHEMWSNPIYETFNGLPRVALEKMTKYKERGVSTPLGYPGVWAVGTTVYVSVLVEVPDNDPYLDSTRGGDPFIFVQFTTSQYEIVQVKTIIKDNTRTTRVNPKASLANLVAGGIPMSFPNDYDQFNLSGEWRNRAFNSVARFPTALMDKKVALFKRYGATNQLQITWFTDNKDHFNNVSLQFPLLPHFAPNREYLSTFLDPGVDTFRMGPGGGDTGPISGFIQQHLNVLSLGLTWLPMDYTKKGNNAHQPELVGP